MKKFIFSICMLLFISGCNNELCKQFITSGYLETSWQDPSIESDFAYLTDTCIYFSDPDLGTHILLKDNIRDKLTENELTPNKEYFIYHLEINEDSKIQNLTAKLLRFTRFCARYSINNKVSIISNKELSPCATSIKFYRNCDPYYYIEIDSTSIKMGTCNKIEAIRKEDVFKILTQTKGKIGLSINIKGNALDYKDNLQLLRDILVILNKRDFLYEIKVTDISCLKI